MYKYPKIKIQTKEMNGSPIYTEIFIDGVLIKGIRSWKLTHDVGNSIPVLTIDLNAFNISTDSAALVMQAGLGNIESIKVEGYGNVSVCQ